MSKSETTDVKMLFSQSLADLMEEMGITRDRYSDSEISRIVRACVNDGYDVAWAEFMAWVMYGDDKRAMTMALIRMGRSGWRSANGV